MLFLGSLETLLLAQRYHFDDVMKRCCEHLKHTLNTAMLNSETKLKEINLETMNGVLVSRVKHLEILLETFKRKVSSACEKFRDIKALPGYSDNVPHCGRHSETTESCQDCMRNVRILINKLCEEGTELTE